MITYSTASGSSLSDQRLDAIVVPTNRSSECLSYALGLARATSAFLLVFCSGRASATDVENRILSNEVQGLAVDVPASYQHPLFLGFETDNFPEAMLGRAANDLSLKRNLGLILGRVAGWSRLLYLDDDITNVKGIDKAISFTTNGPAAGFLVSEFPDNSVVRHAERLSGIEPGVKMSGGALMINVAAVSAFFPRIYNEDWFFLSGYESTSYSDVAGAARQRHYDPFKPSRAASEEFGDLLAEGILQLTSAGMDYLQASQSDWRLLIAERKLLIRKIRSQMGTQVTEHLAVKSLLEAEARLDGIAPQVCVAYITAWSHDLDLFRERFASLSYQGTSLAQIVETIGLTPIQTFTAEHSVF